MQACLTFIAVIALWLVGMPAAVQAEQPKRLPQVGFLFIVPRADYDPRRTPLGTLCWKD